MRTFKRTLSIHGHHAVFGLAVMSLTVLILWWTMFLLNSIKQQRALHLKNVTITMNFLGSKLGGEAAPPSTGPLPMDGRFEILEKGSANRQFSKPLSPRWPHLYIQVHHSVLEEIYATYRRRRFMLIGEAVFLFVLIISSIYFVYRYVLTQKSSTREMENFWTHVTHEIKTPISAIKAFLESMKNQSISRDKLIPFVNMALQEVEKQEKFANNILAGSAMVSNRYMDRLPLEKINLKVFVEEYFANHLLDFDKEGRELKINPANGADIRAWGNRNALKIILDNIIDNALKYGHDALKLTVDIYPGKKYAVISVKDNGPGILPELKEKIFNAFRYLNEQVLVENHGSGMGLHISRNLARNMKGDLKAQTDDSMEGARFNLYLRAVKHGV